MADDGSFDGSYAAQGAALGSAVGPWGTLIGAGAGLALGGVKYLLGGAQRRQAASIKPVDPGYQLNQDVIDNSRVLGDNYSNYQLPGYQAILDQVKQQGETAQVAAERGATSSADVLDAANKGNQVQQGQLNKLGVQTAEGKNSALMQYLSAKAQAGAELENKNTYDREQYNQQLQLKNQLNNNATANQYGAADQASKLIAAIFSYKGGVKPPGPTGRVSPGQSIFDTPVQQTSANTDQLG